MTSSRLCQCSFIFLSIVPSPSVAVAGPSATSITRRGCHKFLINRPIYICRDSRDGSLFFGRRGRYRYRAPGVHRDESNKAGDRDLAPGCAQDRSQRNTHRKKGKSQSACLLSVSFGKFPHDRGARLGKLSYPITTLICQNVFVVFNFKLVIFMPSECK